MKDFLRVSLVAAAAAALAPAAGIAGGMIDGRTGPTTITGHDIDHAMEALSGFVAAKYAESDLLDRLETAPSADFRTVAVATATVPFERAEPAASSFGWPISGDKSLDVQLASFQEDVMGRGEDLFVRIAMVEAGKLQDFAAIASDVYGGTDSFEGRVMDDPTLDGEMAALAVGLQRFDNRDALLTRSVPAVSTTSFDVYARSLALY